MYRDMAGALGRDADAEEPVPFDIADPAYVKAAFDYIYHPYEKDGVDFWWLDWQQGGVTKVPGLDPLWMLNYYHYEDSRRDGRYDCLMEITRVSAVVHGDGEQHRLWLVEP